MDERRKVSIMDVVLGILISGSCALGVGLMTLGITASPVGAVALMIVAFLICVRVFCR